MQRQQPHALFRFGQAFKALQSVSKEMPLRHFKAEAKIVVDFLEKNNYSVSAGVFNNNIKKILEKLEDKTDDSKNIDDALAKSLKQAVSHVFETVQVEAKNQQLYQITEKRYSSEKLLEKVDSLFAQNVYSALPEIAKFDVKEACSCILFERCTAAGFHLMRASEAVVKDLYERLSGSTTVPGNGTWGAYETALATLSTPPNTEIMEQLRHIRRNFRNPTQHPEKKYDLDEVQDLLNLCIDLINRAAKVK